MELTTHSEYHPMESVLLGKVELAFSSTSKLKSEWKALNYSSVPDYTKALKEYREFEDILKNRGIAISYLPASRRTTIDAIYCRDASFLTDHGAILSNMGKTQRSTEPEVHRAFYGSHNIPILGNIQPPGSIEGGDIAWLDERTLAVGHSYRTNKEGIAQLKDLLSPFGIEVIVAELPHYKGPGDVFHLMSVFSPVSSNLAVVYSPLMPIHFRNLLLERGYGFVEVPEEEFDSLGCNVLALAPDTCVMVSGNPVTERGLKENGLVVLTYRGEEISVKGGGGPTCLTRPLSRKR